MSADIYTTDTRLGTAIILKSHTLTYIYLTKLHITPDIKSLHQRTVSYIQRNQIILLAVQMCKLFIISDIQTLKSAVRTRKMLEQRIMRYIYRSERGTYSLRDMTF